VPSMAPRCERPGCGEPASVSYGFDVDQTMVWLEPLRPEGPAAGRLCGRHADTLTVPRGWWLRDCRDEAALFVSPGDASPLYRPKRARRRGRSPDDEPRLAVVATGTDGVRWSPTFDPDSDVDGLLAARTPLLARAFQGPAPAPRAAEG
jgi:Protein of unknown function (DUF3499)